MRILRIPGTVSVIFGLACATGAVIFFFLEGSTTALGLVGGITVLAADPLIQGLAYSFNLVEFAGWLIVFAPLARTIPITSTKVIGKGDWALTVENLLDVVAASAIVGFYFFNAITTGNGLIARGVPQQIARPLGYLSTSIVEILSVGAYWGIKQGREDLQ